MPVRKIRIRYGSALVMAILLSHTVPASSAPNPDAANWGCYDPEPGHPSAAERIAFFEKIAGPARLAEQHHGVPAAGLAAMSMLESGYGFTRTAQFANNLFGWKAPQTDTASYVLTCQPASDPGNHYRRFPNWAAALDYVGRRLGTEATHKQYASATFAYARERAAGTQVPEAVQHWVQRIQQGGYNPDPSYVGRVVRIANNYQSPGDSVSSTLDLYQLSQGSSPTVTPPAPPLETSGQNAMPDSVGGLNSRLGPPPTSLPQGKVAELTKFLAKRPPYMRQDCSEIAAPGYEVIPAGPERPMRCLYHVESTSPKAKIRGVKKATADVIFPTPARMARWIIDSCLWAGGADLAGCIAFLQTGPAGILQQSSAQFPIAGIVFEDMDARLMKGYAFRDGLTARVDGWTNGSEASPTSEQTKAALEQPPLWISEHARVARGDIAEVKCLDPSASFDPKLRDDRWRDYVRARFVEALQGDHNMLLLAQVFAHYHPDACIHR
ncbi:MAG: glucosaminidase domain-containing protein [Rhodospirillales bacterium]|nr:glucosaminidase domain-containing protein [Rhodospirillales bacterium]